MSTATPTQRPPSPPGEGDEVHEEGGAGERRPVEAKTTLRERLEEVSLPEPLARALEVARSPHPAAKLGRAVVAAVVFLLAVRVIFDPPTGLLLLGAANGSLYGLIAVGLILIYRTNRIINFAVAAIGAVPAVAGVVLMQVRGVPYWVGLIMALVGGPLIGGLVDVLIIRRFFAAPRLILTVATIGVAQILAFITVYIPIWIGAEDGIVSFIDTPWKSFEVRDSTNNLVFTGDYVFAVAVVLGMAFALSAFFRYTRMGIALRASAENADRASLLGIPVARVETVAWVIAGLFASVTIFLRSPLIGVPANGALGYEILLFALAAAVIARMESIPIAIAAGMAASIVEQASFVSTGSPDLAKAIMLLFILAGLLFQRGHLSRAYDSGVSTWQALKEYRPVPSELRRIREVVGAKWLLAALVLAIVVLAPYTMSAGREAKLSYLPIFGIVAASLVILTGWAGQISLGQFAIVGAGAVAAGKLAADFNQDFWVTFVAGALAGALVAVLIGLPAVRIQGLYLAVTTLALAGATEFYFLKPTYGFGKLVLPDERVERPVLWERIDLNQDRTFYYFCCAILLLVVLAASSFRRHRSGRVLIAARENQRAAPSYAINLIRTRLAAFAIAGAIAGMAGVLQVYDSRAVDPSTYGMIPSVTVFVATVIGGLTSLPGAVAGAVVIAAVSRYGEDMLTGLSLLVTGPGLLMILLFLPGGFAQAGYALRDGYLRWVAKRHDILVPSLVADRLVEPDEAETSIVTEAEQHAEEAERLEQEGPSVLCPVCGERIPLAAAPDHPHLRPAGASS